MATILNFLFNTQILNCNTGTNLLFQYTVTLFNLNTIIMFCAYLIIKNKNFENLLLVGMMCNTEHAQLQLQNYINFSIPNTGLLNIIGQYHPPLFFISIICYYINLKKKTKNRFGFTASTNAMLISILLSAWWANQELFWGNYWNWDPVEMSSLLILLTMVYILHKNPQDLYKKTNKIYILLSTLLVAYTINRSDLANSVHKFSSTFLLKIDIPLLIFTKAITLFLILISYNKFATNTHINKKNKVTAVILVTIPTIVMVLYLDITTIIGVQYRTVYMHLLINIIILMYLASPDWTIFSKIKIPKIAPHALIYIIVWAVFFIKLPPTNKLFTTKKIKVLESFRPGDLLFYFKNKFNSTPITHGGYIKTRTKNYTLIKSLASLQNIRTFQKPASDILFINISPQNYNNMLFLLLL